MQIVAEVRQSDSGVSIKPGALDILHIPHGDDDGLPVHEGVVGWIDYQLRSISAAGRFKPRTKGL
ncbi:MAG TPA: hypothetical protein VK513_02190 [Terriglobales bacterium]|nr:hypothetical protein [Terriglobales bacterium]